MAVELHSRLMDEARSLLHKHETDIPHVSHVAKLALDLFTFTHALHKSEPRDASLLYCAALLHDIGWSLSDKGAKHHKLSAHLIREHSWKCLNEDEKHVVALTARYHRRKLPRPHHSFYQDLSNQAQRKICTLASFLRIADALDRTHRQIITILEVDRSEKDWIVVAESKSDCFKEARVFSLKKDLFEAHFQVNLLLKLN